MLTKYCNNNFDKCYKTKQNKPSFCQPLVSSSFRHWFCVQFVFVRPTRIVFSVTCVIARIMVAATMSRNIIHISMCMEGRFADTRNKLLRLYPDLQLHVMRWSNVSSAGYLSVWSGVRRPSFSVRSQSVGFKATTRHC